VIYDGIRHLLFMLPALVGLVADALARLDGRAARRYVAPAGALVVVAASLAASARWAPYAYAFVNPVAGIEKHPEAWELDYWGVSGREGVERLRHDGFETVVVQPQPLVGVPFGAVHWDGHLAPHEGMYVFFRLGERAADYGCTPIFTIRRDGHALGEGARCP
jgi:hypothetical protein